MNVEDIFLKFGNGGQRDFFSFETFILNLLKYHIESQGKKFLLVESQRGIGDGQHC